MSNEININGEEIPIEQLKSDWALALMSRGVIVKVSVGRWRAKVRLTPEVLGLKFLDDDVMNFVGKYLSLGEQTLLPPQVMKDISMLEKRARDNLKNYSFDTIWGRFVPFTAFEEWKKSNESVHTDFMNAARQLGNRYDEIVSMVKVDYKNLARDVWARLYPNNKDGVTDSFIEDFASKVVAEIPPREDIVSSFKYESTYFIIPMPSFVEENIARAEEIKREVEMKSLEDDLEKETKKQIADEYRKKKKDLIDGFLDQTVQELRRYVSELCDAVLKTLGKTSKTTDIPKNLKDRLQKMIKKVRYLNFYEDNEVNGLLNELDVEINKFKGERNKDLIIGKLKAIVEIGEEEFTPKNFNPTMGYLKVEL